MNIPYFNQHLNSFSDKQWLLIKDASRQTKRYWNSRDEWLNTKFYKNNPPNHGDVEQTPINGDDPEIPYSRIIFKVKPFRFSLIDKPVAYFSSDYALMSCETIKVLRQSYECSWKVYLEPYLDGVANPTPNAYGYPLNFKLIDNAIILDLTRNSPSIRMMEKYSKINIEYIITSQDNKIYKLTQLISEKAFENGFDGIAYDSVREPSDLNILGNNLVLFKESKITKWSAGN